MAWMLPDSIAGPRAYPGTDDRFEADKIIESLDPA